MPIKTVLRLAVLLIFLILFCTSFCVSRRDLFGAKDLSLYYSEAQGEVMGTTWSVKVYTSELHFDTKLKTVIQEELDRIDGLMSTYKKDSELSRFNNSQSTDWTQVSRDLAAVFSIALEVSRKTEGAFDVTVGPLVNIWRFGPDKTPLNNFPSREKIEEVKKRVGYINLEVRFLPEPSIRKKIPDVYVDLSAVAKGYAVDCAVQKLKEFGVQNAMVEVGGEVRCLGQKYPPNEPAVCWVLGIEKPKISRTMSGSLYRIVQMREASLATSGDYRNYLQLQNVRFSHIIDPRNGRPTEFLTAEEEKTSVHLGSVSVIFESCAYADAWATAFFVLGPTEGLEIANREKIPVLFVSRRGNTVPPQLEEVSSDAFKNNAESEIVK